MLAVVSEGEEEATPDEVTSNTVVELMKRSGALNEIWVLLDSQSTISLFCNPQMLSNIRKCKKGEEKR